MEARVQGGRRIKVKTTIDERVARCRGSWQLQTTPESSSLRLQGCLGGDSRLEDAISLRFRNRGCGRFKRGSLPSLISPTYRWRFRLCKIAAAPLWLLRVDSHPSPRKQGVQGVGPYV